MTAGKAACQQPGVSTAAVALAPESTTCRCGCALRRIGKDVSEKLDYAPGVSSRSVQVRAEDDTELARQLHDEVHAKCFIANSVSFAVGHEAVIECAER